MKKLNKEELSVITGGKTPSARECYIAGIGVVLTSSIVGVLTGLFQKNWNTFKTCF